MLVRADRAGNRQLCLEPDARGQEGPNRETGVSSRTRCCIMPTGSCFKRDPVRLIVTESCSKQPEVRSLSHNNTTIGQMNKPLILVIPITGLPRRRFVAFM